MVYFGDGYASTSTEISKSYLTYYLPDEGTSPFDLIDKVFVNPGQETHEKKVQKTKKSAWISSSIVGGVALLLSIAIGVLALLSENQRGGIIALAIAPVVAYAFFALIFVLVMAQDENIAKMEALFSFCQKEGYLSAYLDAELLSFQDYLEPLTPSKDKTFFLQRVAANGGFNQNDLRMMEKTFPDVEKKELKRLVAELILQDPYLCNRYCHDDPELVNAVKVPSPLPYKIFH